MSLPEWIWETCRWCRGTCRGGIEKRGRCEDCEGTGKVAACEVCDEAPGDCICECEACGMERDECICDELSEEGTD